MRRFFLFGLMLVLLPGILSAQQAMNNDSVMQLVKAGLSEDLIIATINASPADYDISAAGLIALTQAGVSEKVLAVILTRSGSGAPAAHAPNATDQESSSQSQDGRPRIAILEIPAAQGAYTGWNGYWWRDRQNEVRTSNVLRELFTTEFLNQGSGRIRVMERAQLDAIRGEQAFSQSDEVDTATAVNLGKILGVNYIVTGKITRFAQKKGSFKTGWGVGTLVRRATGSNTAGAVAGSAKVGNASLDGRLDMRIIDVETSEIIAAVAEEGATNNVSVMVAGTGNDIQYDDGMVNEVFEPIVRKITPGLINRLMNSQ